MPANSYGGSEEEILGALGAYFACVGFFVFLMIAFYVFLFWRILDKAGFSPWLSLLNLVGGIGTLVLLGILAFGEWPALKRQQAPSYTPPGPGSQGGYPPPSPPTYSEPPLPPQQPPGPPA